MAPASYREPGLRLIANSPCFLRPSASSFPEPTHGARAPSTAPSPCGHHARAPPRCRLCTRPSAPGRDEGSSYARRRWQSRPVVAHL